MALPCCQRSASAAGSFVQLASRSSWACMAPSRVPLDFLVPWRVGTHNLRGASPRQTISRRVAMSTHTRCLSQRPQVRRFTASAHRYATKNVLNPRTDDDGNDMMLEMTPRAATRLSEIMKKDNNPNLALRIQVESGGCHGFQYLMNLVTIPGKDAQEWSSVVGEDDSIFQYYPNDADANEELSDSPRLILDEPSLELLKGSKVDFTKELIGSQFKIVDNPYATSSCGCGTSFDIKM